MRTFAFGLIWLVASAFILPPGTAVTGTGTANVLYCLRATSPATMTANTIAVQYTNGGAAATVGGLAVYNSSGNVLASNSAALSAGTHGTLTITSAGVSLTRGLGDILFWCWCSSNNTTWSRTGGTGTGVAGKVPDLIGINNVWYGTAPNGCSAGAPPATIGGALSASSVDMVIRVSVQP